MKKIFSTIIITLSIIPNLTYAKVLDYQITKASIVSFRDMAEISWKNPDHFTYSQTILFKSSIPIEDYFSYEAVEGLCELIYSGNEEKYTANNLAPNLPYYFILFTKNKGGQYSKAVVLKKEIVAKNKSIEKKFDPKEKLLDDTNSNNNSSNLTPVTLADLPPTQVNRVSLSEAGFLYNYNQPVKTKPGSNSARLALFIIVRSPHELSESDKNSISYFIHSGTPTTIVLGGGERAGVLNSYLSVFKKLPRNTLEWQDVIKIANGRWPAEKNIESEKQAANEYFSAIYQRSPDMDNANDNAAVTVIAYGLRPAKRNMESEKNAINIFKSIFKKNPSSASDWDLIRAIAYSGATR